ncbi:division/cell wall cluster transcriptional repressor MraZ [Treponema pedis]|nr:division/cell wall cluster transcriptional repressor MraZ [Treponema pedis]QOW62178.1 division/cell wall cluster transcriptional repressor MraZ [Treponema pedis]QSI05273.1 transcriptional regulator MraZ [Treponema pedis]
MTGEYKNTLDEKGRIMFPAKIRSGLPEARLIITRGIDSCLWLFTPEEWQKLSDEIMAKASLFKTESRIVTRRLIAPAQEIEFDKTGRLSVPQSLREYAGLEKDCIILGLSKYFELWDEKKYENYLKESESGFLEAAEGLGTIGL